MICALLWVRDHLVHLDHLDSTPWHPMHDLALNPNSFQPNASHPPSVPCLGLHGLQEGHQGVELETHQVVHVSHHRQQASEPPAGSVELEPAVESHELVERFQIQLAFCLCGVGDLNGRPYLKNHRLNSYNHPRCLQRKPWDLQQIRALNSQSRHLNKRRALRAVWVWVRVVPSLRYHRWNCRVCCAVCSSS